MDNILIVSLLYAVSLLPPHYLRYAPFRTLIDNATKKKLIIGTAIIFIAEIIVVPALFISGYLPFNDESFTKLYQVGYLPYVLLTVLLIRPYWYQHLFILGFQGMYTATLHSFLFSVHGAEAGMVEYFVLYLLLFAAGLVPIRNVLDYIFIKEDFMDKTVLWKWMSPVPLLLVYYQAQLMHIEQLIDSDNHLQHFLQIIIFVLLSYSLKNIIHRLHMLETALQKRSEAHRQMALLSRLATQVREGESRLRIIRHDTRHHMLILSELIDAGRFEEAEAFISHLREEEDNDNA